MSNSPLPNTPPQGNEDEEDGGSDIPNPTPPPSRYLQVKRSDRSAFLLGPVIPKEKRKILSNKELVNLHENATKPLPNKFSLPDAHNTEEIFTRTYNISNNIRDLRKRLIDYDMLDVFFLLSPMDVNSITNEVIGPTLFTDFRGQPTTVDLLSKYASTPLLDVQRHTEFLHFYGQDYDHQNLSWSQALLSNSCDETLKSKVNERMSSQLDTYEGGPTFLWHVLQLIVSTSETASKALLDRLENIKIHEIEGENILTITSLLTGAIDRLTIVNKLPPDLIDKLLTIFQTSSVKEFNSIFAAMKLHQTCKIRSYTSKEIIQLADTWYTELWEKKHWIGAGSDHSVFVTCWNCHKDGHISTECPDKPASTSNKFNKKYNRNDPIFTTAPTDGSKVKHINGKRHYWCHHCGRWTTNHGTSKHRGKKKNQRNPTKTPEKDAPFTKHEAHVASSTASPPSDAPIDYAETQSQSQDISSVTNPQSAPQSSAYVSSMRKW